MKKGILLLACLLTSVQTFADTHGTCWPSKKRSLFNAISAPITYLAESDALVIQQRLLALYAQDAAALGGNLSMREVEVAEFGAYAYRFPDVDGVAFQVDMQSGMRFHPLISADSYALVACHEIGHHVGGLPLKAGWPSAEGQADYFGAAKCMRRYLESLPPSQLNDATAVFLADVDFCQKSFTDPQAVRICSRTMSANRSLGGILAELGEESVPNFETPDLSVVTVTDIHHPKAQCRLDTYKAAAGCPVDHREAVSYTDSISGVCHKQREPAFQRPACWFADDVTSLASN